MRLPSSASEKEEVAAQIRGLQDAIMAYVVLAMTDPDMFNLPEDADMGAVMLRNCGPGAAFDVDMGAFIQALSTYIRTSDEDGSKAAAVFPPVLNALYKQAGTWIGHAPKSGDGNARDAGPAGGDAHAALQAAFMGMMGPAGQAAGAPSEVPAAPGFQRVRLTHSHTITSLMQACATLLPAKEVQAALAGSEHWLASAGEGGSITGRQVERETFLGRLLGPGPEDDDFTRLPNPQPPLLHAVAGSPPEDLVTGLLHAGYTGRRHGHWPQPLMAAVDGACDSIRAASASTVSSGTALLKGLLKKRGTSEATMQWLGQCIDANAGRDQSAYSLGMLSAGSETSSTALLVHVSRCLMQLCAPFLDPASSAFRKLDARFPLLPQAGGSDRWDMSAGERMCQLAGGAGKWTDVRNLARQQQSEAAQRALIAEAGGGAAPALDEAESPRSLEAASFSKATEFFFMAGRCLVLGWHAARNRMNQIRKRLGQAKDARQRAMRHAGRGLIMAVSVQRIDEQ
ncbi:PUB1, partial [Symbiodinium sp. KB8]